MGIFKDRNKKTIAELENYYSNRQGSGMAWIMAFLSLLVTVVVLAALFFGGRWLYRTISNNNGSDDATTTSIEQPPVEVTIGVNEELTTTTDPDNTNSDSEGVVSDEAASTDTPSSSTDSGSTSQVRGTENVSAIPDTGAGEMIVIAPIFAAVVGYYISRKRQLS